MNQILQAAGETIVQRGVDRGGINTIADRAGVNKVLIYRYFGGLNRLIEAFYEKVLADISEQADVKKSKKTVSNSCSTCEQYIITYDQALRANLAWQYLIRWQMDKKPTDLAQRFSSLQEQFILLIISADIIEAGVVRFLLAGITHSILMEDKQVLGLTEQVIRRVLRPIALSQPQVAYELGATAVLTK